MALAKDLALEDRAEPLCAGRMFNVSRRTLGVIAVIAIVLLVLGLATDIGLFGWVPDRHSGS
jgi:hypothetical protein